MSRTTKHHFQYERVQRFSLVLGVLGLMGSVAGAVADPQQFFRAYLFTYHFWYSLSLGSLAVLMIFHLTGGRWGVLTQRILEAAIRTIPLMALLFLPLLFGLHELYPWTLPDVVASSPALQHKQVYLNVTAFVTRAIVYFIIWMALAYLLTNWSLRQDRTTNPIWARRLWRLSAGGLILYSLTVSFAAIDWVMSLEPDWYSTIYGAIAMMGQALEALAFVIIMVYLLADRETIQTILSFKALIDLGNLLLAFVILWTYMMFSQYLIIWMGNLVEEIPWSLRRQSGGWQWVGISLVAFHFFLPLVLLLFRAIKRDPAKLVWVAAFLMLMRLVNLYWVVTPAFYSRVYVNWMDWATLLGMGGFWMLVFTRQLERAPLVAPHNPRLKEVLATEAHHG